jgi:serine/threonine protein kinase
LQIFAKNGSPLLRSMIDEIQEPAEPVTIVLEYLDTDLDVSSREKTLSRQEVKYVAKKVLQALEILHDKGYVHTDVKLMNILANTSNENPSNRFSSIKLADFGETFHIDSKQAKEAMPISSAIWRSPEAQLQVDSGWNTATDIWSFGLCVSNTCSTCLARDLH